MAEKRMFSKKIIDTDWFMDMPASTQNLYFHLSMRADDDGFVASPKRIIKLIGATEDDYKILIAKKFIIPFDSGICVITDWRINNYLRNDRYTETVYKEEKDSLVLDEKGKYELGIPTVDPVLSISNSSSNSILISNSNNKEKKSKEFIPPTLDEVKEYASSRDRLDLAQKFFDYYEAGKWVDGKGNKVKNWKQKFITWEMKDTKPKQQEQIGEKPDLTKRRFDTDGVELFYVEGKWYRLDSQMFKFGLTCLEDGRCIQNGKLL